MNTPTIPAIVLPFLLMGGILVGTAQPAAGDATTSRLEGSLSDALKSPQTNGIAELREGYSGELKTVFTWGVAAKLKDEHRRESIEFTHLFFGDRGVGNRCERRTSILAGFADAKTGEFEAYGTPCVFIPNLPETELLKTYRDIEQFKAVFGEFRGMTDGWGSDGEMHSSLCWCGFTPAQSNAIRVVSVFLHTVGKRQTPKQERTWTIEGISIQEGVFVATGRKPRMRKYEGVKQPFSGQGINACGSGWEYLRRSLPSWSGYRIRRSTFGKANQGC